MAHSSSSKTTSNQNSKRKQSKEDDFHETMGSLLQEVKELNEKINAQNRHVKKLEKDLRSAELSKKEMQIKVKELMKRIDSKSQCFPENESINNSVEKENEKITKLLSENSALKNTVERQNEEIKKISLLLSEYMTSKTIIGDLEEEIANLNGQLTDKEFQLNKDVVRSISIDFDFKSSDELQSEIDNLNSQLNITKEVFKNKRRENEFSLAVINQQMHELTEKDFVSFPSQTHINDLSEELLLEIFSYAKPTDWLHSIPNVCSEWRKVSKSVWRQVQYFAYSDDESFFLSLADGRHFSVKCKNVSANEICIGNVMSDADVCLKNCAETLKSFNMNLSSLRGVKGQRVLLLLVKCEKLKSLGLSGNMDISVIDCLARVCENLPNLDKIRCNCSNLDPSKYVASILALRQNLRNVSFYFTDKANLPNVNVFNGLVALPLEKFRLQVSNPVCPTFISGILSTLSNCNNQLKKVHLAIEIYEPLLNSSQCQQFLTKLGEKNIENFSFNVGLADEDIEIAPMTADILTPLSQFPNLHKLELNNFDWSEPAMLETLRKLAPQLTSLTLFNNFNFSSSYFKGWSFELPKLQKLTIVEDDISSHKGVANFVAKCPNLIYLYISFSLFDYAKFVLLLHKNLHTCADNDEHVCKSNLAINFSDSLIDEDSKNLQGLGLCGFDMVDDYEGHLSRCCCWR